LEHLEDLVRSARREADQAEAFLFSSRATTVGFEANQLKEVQTRESSRIALRIFREGRVGFAIASGGDDLQALVDMAVETSQFGSPANFDFPSRQKYTEVKTFAPETQEIPMERMAEIGKELIAKIKGHTPDILCDAEVARGISSISLVNSQGGEGSYDSTSFSVSLEGVLVRDTDMLFVGDSESSCRHDKIRIGDLAGRIIWQLEMAKKRATVSSGLLPIIFTPNGVASALLSPLVLAFSGKSVLEGASSRFLTKD